MFARYVVLELLFTKSRFRVKAAAVRLRGKAGPGTRRGAPAEDGRRSRPPAGPALMP